MSYESNTMANHTNKTALITGVSKGVGFKLLERFLFEGYKVIGTYRILNNQLQNLLDENSSRLTLKYMDLESIESITNLAKEISGTSIDILVINAIIAGFATFTNEKGIYGNGSEGIYEFNRYIIANAVNNFHLAKLLNKNIAQSTDKTVLAISSLSGSVSNKVFVKKYYHPELKEFANLEFNPNDFNDLSGGKDINLLLESSNDQNMDLGLYTTYAYSRSVFNSLFLDYSIQYAQDGIKTLLMHPGSVKSETSREFKEALYKQSYSGSFFLSLAKYLSIDNIIYNMFFPGLTVEQCVTYTYENVVNNATRYKIGDFIDSKGRKMESLLSDYHIKNMSLGLTDIQKATLENQNHPKTILITGLDDDWGGDLLGRFLLEDYKIIGTYRTLNKELKHLLDENSSRLTLKYMDLESIESITNLAKEISETSIDILVLNAVSTGLATLADEKSTYEKGSDGIHEFNQYIIANAMNNFHLAKLLHNNIAQSTDKIILAISSLAGSVSNKVFVKKYYYPESKEYANFEFNPNDFKGIDNNISSVLRSFHDKSDGSNLYTTYAYSREIYDALFLDYSIQYSQDGIKTFLMHPESIKVERNIELSGEHTIKNDQIVHDEL